jgi:hypothetical protein
MTGKEFRIICIELGLDPGQIAQLFHVAPRSVRHWNKHGIDEGSWGKKAVVVAVSLRLLQGVHQHHPDGVSQLIADFLKHNQNPV